ncbi:MAG: hypothetical protein GZ088_13835 [Acidipila sp.]|nr:hypothetical protein [Acidipila sp.]
MGPKVRVRASQKWFTEAEVSRLLNVTADELRSFARNKQVGILEKAAEVAGVTPEHLLFTLSDLMILSVLFHRIHS